MKTSITELFGIELPIICGGMHHVGFAELAAAVSEAGGLGMITALTQPDADALRAEIKKCKALTSKPFAVNLTLLPSLKPPNYESFANVIIEEGIKIVETAGRSPDKFIKLFKANGIKVIHKCVQIKHALSAQKAGADAISLDGFECAGHPGEIAVGNWVLTPRGMEELKIPFVVSGGVANGHQLAGALVMGAAGVNMGTRFMATKECTIHDNIKNAIVNANENHTTLIFTTLKNTERVYKNPTTLKVNEIEKEHPGDFSKIADYVKGDNYRRSFHETGNIDDSAWSCGQSMGLIHDVPTCKELLNRMVSECKESLARAQNMASRL